MNQDQLSDTGEPSSLQEQTEPSDLSELAE